MRLPGEDELRKAIRADLASELQVTSDLLSIGTGVFLTPVRPNPKDEMDHLEAWMCLGIVAKACRQYRGIVALAEIALGDVADSNGRMLAETMLAAEFLMRPTLVLKRGGKPLPEVPGFPLTTAFRTKLYLAHDAASLLKTLKEIAKYGEISAEDANRALKVAEEHAKEEADGIGSEWAKRQKEGRSYSGVGVLDLAESIDMPFLYHTFYRPASAGVHGTDARKYIEPEERPDGGITFHACSSEKGVAEALIFASLVMLQVLNVANQRFGLGLDERLSEIAPRIQNMARRLPNE
ncbi:MAG TPA: hypothetical protein DDY78_08350 [Planctomycetales bacterium]|jgi:hypothetical protein|nr:hypothetical protein [Planctomycetales bacterium]